MLAGNSGLQHFVTVPPVPQAGLAKASRPGWKRASMSRGGQLPVPGTSSLCAVSRKARRPLIKDHTATQKESFGESQRSSRTVPVLGSFPRISVHGWTKVSLSLKWTHFSGFCVRD